MSFDVHIIGGGLAGSEAAWQLATSAEPPNRIASFLIAYSPILKLVAALNRPAQARFQSVSGMEVNDLGVRRNAVVAFALNGVG